MTELRKIWQNKYPEIVTVFVWVGLFVVLLPYEFRDNAWPWLTVKILGSVIASVLLPIPLTVPLYLMLKSS